MSKAKKQWTDSYIRNLPIKDKAYNEMQNNLRLRIYPTGTKSWSFYKKDLSGLRTPQNLGTFPEVSLAQARKMATVQASNIYTKGHGIDTQTKGISYRDFIASEQYQATGRLRSSHKEIMKNLQSKVTGLPDAVQNLPIKAITHQHIESYIDKRLKAGTKKGTINKNLTNIRSVFRVAFDKSVVGKNIMSKVKQLQDDTAEEKLALTPDERKRLIDTAEDMTLPQAHKRKHMSIFIHLGLDTGLRGKELLSLKWRDFSNDNMVTVDNYIQGVQFKYQTPKILIAVNKDGDELSESQMIKQYKVDKRLLTVLRFYPSIDQTKDDHKNIKEFEKNLKKDGYKLKIDDRRKWYITVPADTAKSRKERVVGVRDRTMQILMTYLKELYKPGTKNKKGYVTYYWDDNCNPLYEEVGKEKGNVKGFTDIGYMQDRLLFPQSKLSATGKNKPNKPIKRVRGTFNTIRKYAGLPKAITPHTLRHHFCSDLAMQGINPIEIMRHAGHSDIKTTMRYVHAVQAKDFSGLDKADKRRSS